MKKNVCVIGLGYIGLPTAALLAKNGHNVIGVDIKNEVVDVINKGEVHIVEPDLNIIVKQVVNNGNLTASTIPVASDIYIICVPTPFNIINNIPSPNIDYVINATRSIAHLLKNEDIIILESTSPVGTTIRIKEELEILNIDTSNINFAYCPERVLPGNILYELIHNDRIVGGINEKSSKVVKEFYKTFIKGTVFETDDKTAEMCKLTENSFRDINIAFANELSIICKSENINVYDLINLANKHPRVNILQPGVGVGGHCIAVDPWFIVSRNPENSNLIKTAREVNNYKPIWVFNCIKQKLSDTNIINPIISIFGLSFKPDIDDLRESPALEIANMLIEENFNLTFVEPNIKQHKKFKMVTIDEAVSNSHVLIFLVKHKEFLNPTFKSSIKNKIILDFCGLLN